MRCGACDDSHLVAFSGKGRGLCPSCLGGRRASTAANLIERVLPPSPLRQWVLAVPFAWRARLAYDGELLSSTSTGSTLRPAVAQERITRGPDGLVRIALKRPFSDGTVAVDLDPLSLLSRLGASVPPPRLHSVGYARRARPCEQAPIGHRPRAPHAPGNHGRPGRVGGADLEAGWLPLRAVGRAPQANVRRRRARVPDVQRADEAARRSHRPEVHRAHPATPRRADRTAHAGACQGTSLLEEQRAAP